MEESPFFIYGDMFVCDYDASPPASQYFDPIIPYLGWIYTVENIDRILREKSKKQDCNQNRYSESNRFEIV